MSCQHGFVSLDVIELATQLFVVAEFFCQLAEPGGEAALGGFGGEIVVMDILGGRVVAACLSYPYVVVLVACAGVAFDGEVQNDY